MTASLRLRLAIVLSSLVLATACGGGPMEPVNGSSVAVSDKPRDRNPAVVPEQVASLAGSNSAFAFDLYGNIRSLDGNLFFSPYSISTALAMTYAGAAGQPADQRAGPAPFDLEGS